MPRKPKAERNEEPVPPANPHQPELRTIPITTLLPDEKNPRKDLQPADPEYQKIKTSIEQFQFLDPIVFNSRTLKVIGGHQRLKILKDTGITDLFILSLGAYSWAFSQADLQEMSPAMETAANIALNRASGDWDNEKLAEALNNIKIGGLDINITGFNEKELVIFLANRSGVKVDDPLKEWEGMPEYPSKDLTAFRTLYVHFKNNDDVNAFAELINQKISDKTKFIWYPKTEILYSSLVIEDDQHDES